MHLSEALGRGLSRSLVSAKCSDAPRRKSGPAKFLGTVTPPRWGRGASGVFAPRASKPIEPTLAEIRISLERRQLELPIRASLLTLSPMNFSAASASYYVHAREIPHELFLLRHSVLLSLLGRFIYTLMSHSDS